MSTLLKVPKLHEDPTPEFIACMIVPIVSGMRMYLKDHAIPSIIVLSAKAVRTVDAMTHSERMDLGAYFCSQVYKRFNPDGDMKELQMWSVAFYWWTMYMNSMYVKKSGFPEHTRALQVIASYTLEDMHRMLHHDPNAPFYKKETEMYKGSPESMVPSGLTVCNTCGRVDTENTLFYCIRCGMRAYCGEACQKADWANAHRLYCGRQPLFWREEFLKGALYAL